MIAFNIQDAQFAGDIPSTLWHRDIPSTLRVPWVTDDKPMEHCEVNWWSPSDIVEGTSGKRDRDEL